MNIKNISQNLQSIQKEMWLFGDNVKEKAFKMAFRKAVLTTKDKS